MERIFKGEWLAHDGLNQEAFESFCLNLRQMVQNTDGYSMKLVGDIAEKWAEEHHDLRNEVREARAILSQRLDEPCLVRIHDNRRTTNRELFDVVFYGGVVHENVGKRDEFDRIIGSGVFSYFVFQAFLGILFYYRNCILRMAVHVEKYLIRERLIPAD
ncbi:hypothetical protein [Pseudomonas sp. AA-38]|uniref:hypothetical protein n=1 Tax=Pseudomonas sp. AA-38 TaxID=3028807 RepID=UPI0023F7AAA4|nr:hypothetical protein [Pseudomonas sp. AA-38]